MSLCIKAVLAFVLVVLVVPAGADEANQPSAGPSVDRSAIVSELLARWTGSTSDGGAELSANLQRATPDTLAASAQADTWEGVRSALLGGFLPQTLGDASSDLVFFPLAPCRLVDTRLGGGMIAANTNRAFETQGNMSAQGGSAVGCGVPGVDPAALSITVTAVNPQGAGNLRAYAAAGPVPLASALNFALPGTGLNLANTTIVPLTQDAGNPSEFAIQADVSATHVVVDVVGYFDRAGLNIPADFDDQINNLNLAAGINYIMSATTIVPTRTLTCLVNVHGAWFQSGGVPAVGFGQIKTALRNVTAGTNASDNSIGWNNYMGALGDNMGTGTKSAIWTLTAGTTWAFGCAASASGDFVGDAVYCTVSWMCR